MSNGLVILDDAHRERRLRVQAQTSASMIDQYEQCPRKFFNSYILGDRQPQTDAQARGTDIDDNYVQPYLKTGAIRTTASTTGNWSALLREMIPHLPKPGPRENLLVQHRIELATYEGGPKCIGFADWIEELPDDEIYVGDLKSTSDFKYCKTQAQLIDNTQMVTYAAWAFYVGAARVSIAHVYGRTRGAAKAHRSPLLRDGIGYFVSKDEIAERWSRRLEMVREMVEIARSCVKADDLPPNTSSCGMYGGCYYRSKCGLTIGALVAGARKEKKTMENGQKGTSRLLTLLKGRNGGAPAAPPKEVAAPMEEVKPEAEAPAPAGGIRSLFAKKPLAQQTPGEKGVEGYKAGQLCNGKGFYANTNGQGFTNVEPGHSCANCTTVKIEPGQVLPPESIDQRTSTPEEVAAAEAGARGKKAKKEPKPKEISVKVECEICGEKVAVADSDAHAAKHAPTQTMLDVVVDPSTHVVRAEVVPTPKRDPRVRELSEKLQAEMAQNGKPSTRKMPLVKPRIYIDALPSKLPDELVAAAVTLDEWLAPMTELVAQANDVTDIRLLPYGTAKGGLATAIRECIDSCPAVLLVRSKHPDASLALEVLTPYAEEVIQGVAA